MLCIEEIARVGLVHGEMPFESLSGTYVRQRFAPHLHDTYAIGAMERGAARLRYRGANVTHIAGDVITLEPLEVHTGEAVDAGGWSYCMLYLPTELMCRLGTGRAEPPRFRSARYADAELAVQIRELYHVLETEPDVLRQASALAGTLHTLCERHGNPDTAVTQRFGSASLARVRDYLETHIKLRPGSSQAP